LIHLPIHRWLSSFEPRLGLALRCILLFVGRFSCCWSWVWWMRRRNLTPSLGWRSVLSNENCVMLRLVISRNVQFMLCNIRPTCCWSWVWWMRRRNLTSGGWGDGSSYDFSVLLLGLGSPHPPLVKFLRLIHQTQLQQQLNRPTNRRMQRRAGLGDKGEKKKRKKARYS
jgi:hypothetical protein